MLMQNDVASFCRWISLRRGKYVGTLRWGLCGCSVMRLAVCRSLSSQTSTWICGGPRLLIWTSNKSPTWCDIATSRQYPSCQRLLTSNVVNQVGRVRPMVLNQLHDPGFFKAEFADIRLEILVGIFP